MNHGADIEAQSERTKDTPLSLACSGGRYEVVEILLARGANKVRRHGPSRAVRLSFDFKQIERPIVAIN